MTPKKGLLIILSVLLLGTAFLYATTDSKILHKKPSHIEIEYSNCDNTLSITDSTVTNLQGINIFIIGKNEYNEVDTFMEGFAYIPLHLSVKSFYPGTYDVVVETEDTTVIKQVTIQYCH